MLYPSNKVNKIIKTILLVGTTEIILNKTPAKVIVSEYINIAHGFFKGNESKIINAVLDSIIKKNIFVKKRKLIVVLLFPSAYFILPTCRLFDTFY